MSTWSYSLFYTHFTQSLLAAAAVAILPLSHRRRWKLRLITGMVLGFLLGGMLEYGSTVFLADMPWFLPIYYLLPLALSYILVYITADVTLAERINVMSIAYLCQHMGFCLSAMLFGIPIPSEPSTYTWVYLFGRWAFHLLVYIAAYYLIIRKLPEQGRLKATMRSACVRFAMVLLIALGLNYFYKTTTHEVGLAYNIGLAYDLFSCAFLLWIQLEQRRESALWIQLETERRLRIQNKEQYERSRTNLALINQKCHDLKHHLTALRLEKDQALREQGLQEMEQAVLIYDAVAETGNEVLDTVLTEKSLICEQDHISWTCMANGALLNFMSAVDLYTLFGNALDNAIESSREIEDGEKRIVSVIVQECRGMVLIQVENYYNHVLQRKDGLPVTTKSDPDQHGYGLKSIASIAQRYDGLLDINAEEGIFLLSILLPLPITNSN